MKLLLLGLISEIDIENIHILANPPPCLLLHGGYKGSEASNLFLCNRERYFTPDLTRLICKVQERTR